MLIISYELTREPSERLCRMGRPDSEGDAPLEGAPFEGCIRLFILFIHSTFSAILSAFKTTALWAAINGKSRFTSSKWY